MMRCVAQGIMIPRLGFEICTTGELMYSFKMLTRISGSSLWADCSERLALNSLYAARMPESYPLS